MNAKKNIHKTPNGSWRTRVMKAGKVYSKNFPTLQLAKLWRDYVHQSKVL